METGWRCRSPIVRVGIADPEANELEGEQQQWCSTNTSDHIPCLSHRACVWAMGDTRRGSRPIGRVIPLRSDTEVRGYNDDARVRALELWMVKRKEQDCSDLPHNPARFTIPGSRNHTNRNYSVQQVS